MGKYRSFIAVIFLSAAVSITISQPVTVSFQQGVNGYTGCHSVDISDLNYAPGNNGTTFGDGNNDWCIGKLHGRPGFGYDISPLLRFDNLGIPTNAVVTNAVLTITHVMWEVPSSRVIGRYLNVPWYGNINDTIGGMGNAPVGWERRLPNTPWSQLGALGEGTDLIANKLFYSPPDGSIMPSNGEVTYNIPLDLEVVQGWISNPATNNGVKMQVDAINVHIYYRPPKRPDVLKRPKLTITYTIPTGIENETGIPQEYYIEQNYPNPFNPVTVINYGIKKAEFVSIKLYDALGSEIKTVVFENKPAGNYSAVLNSSNLSSGVYFYRITAGSYTETKKLSIIK